ncbi:MAG TPA: hypothetical protein VK203_28155 [Nostocaceae cyanobacterium]|nr:hypothetical protein [Nostocaceae cyanobacterium]
MSNNYVCETDFYTDWVNFLKEELSKWGCTIENNEDLEKVSFTYFNLRKRRLMPVVREVLISKEFVCPSQYLAGLELIKERIRRGEDLTPHLSRSVLTDPSYNDDLLNDWGIHHLHLGIVPDARDNRIVERTGPLLFARFDDNYAYLINVLNHGEWANIDFIRVLHNNWPTSIEHCRAENVSSIEPLGDIQAYRDAGEQTFIEIDGVVYLPIGGGYTQSRLSVEVIQYSDYFSAMIRELENRVNNNVSKLVADAQTQGLSLPEKLHIKLVVEKEKIYAEEQSSKFKWPIANLDW